MNIAIFNCYSRSVPPQKSGGIETSIDYLIQGLLARHHTVTLFGPNNNLKRDGLILIDAGEPDIEWRQISEGEKDAANERLTSIIGRELQDTQSSYDIIHNHCAGTGFPYITNMKTPTITTLHEEIVPDTIQRLAPYSSMPFVSISNAQRIPYPLNYVKTIYPGLPIDDFPRVGGARDFLVCISRISEQKTPHYAIEAAATAKKKIYIIGSYKDHSVEQTYFETQFLPTLQKHKEWATWVGEVDRQTVKSYLHDAAALLMPVAFEEPAGMAALEAMACGCPVIACKKGAYPETIVDGKTGFLVSSLEEMVDKIHKVNTINREACRHHIQTHFSLDTMTDAYLEAYRKVIET